MLNNKAWSALLRLAVALALPTIACVSYYTVNSLDDNAQPYSLPISFMYSLAIMGVLGIAAWKLSASPSKLWLWSAIICTALPTGLLIYLRV